MLLAGLAFWLVTLGLGRLLLSCLPPGRIGGHRPAELPVTLAASFATGLVVVCAVSGWDAMIPGDLLSGTGLALLVLAVLVILVVRVATLPGAFVPGPPSAGHRAGRWHRSLRLAAGLALLARFAPALLGLARTVEPEVQVVVIPWIAALASVATALLIHQALELAGASEAEKSLVWIALAVLAWVAPPVLLHDRVVGAMFMLAGGASSLFGWWRRADRRAGVLAAMLFATQIAILPQAWWPGAVGLAALALWTHAGGRALALGASLGSLALLVVPLLLQPALLAADELRWLHLDWPTHLGTSAVLLALCTPLLVLGLSLLIASSRRAPRAT